MDLIELRNQLEETLKETQAKMNECTSVEMYLKLLTQLNSLTSRILQIERLLSRKEREKKKEISQVNVAWVYASGSSRFTCCGVPNGTNPEEGEEQREGGNE